MKISFKKQNGIKINVSEDDSILVKELFKKLATTTLNEGYQVGRYHGERIKLERDSLEEIASKSYMERDHKIIKKD